MIRHQMEEAAAQLRPIALAGTVGPNPSNSSPPVAVSQAQVDRLQGYYATITDWLQNPQDFDVSGAYAGLALGGPVAWAGGAAGLVWASDYDSCLDLADADAGTMKDWFLSSEPCESWIAQVQSTLGNAALLLSEMGYAGAGEVVSSAQESVQGQLGRAQATNGIEIPLWLKISAAVAGIVVIYNWSK